MVCPMLVSRCAVDRFGDVDVTVVVRGVFALY
jgi:hypothetical protein